MKIYKKKLVLLVLLLLAIIPIGKFAMYSQKIHAFHYYLGGQKIAMYAFTSEPNHKFQNYTASVSNLEHDGDMDGCNFCKLNVKVQKKLGLFFQTIVEKDHSVANPGYSETVNLGEVGKGDFRYIIKNNGAFQMDGFMSISEQDEYN